MGFFVRRGSSLCFGKRGGASPPPVHGDLPSFQKPSHPALGRRVAETACSIMRPQPRLIALQGFLPPSLLLLLLLLQVDRLIDDRSERVTYTPTLRPPYVALLDSLRLVDLLTGRDRLGCQRQCWFR